MERFRRGDHSKINDSYACNIYYTSCRYNSWELDVFWNCSALIYYGLKFLNPHYFLVSAFLISAISSLATGTAWGSASTAGIALISIAHQLNIDMGMAAGAIIAGAVFGDKMSPLSDTTNLAALVTKVNIFLISDQ